MSFVYPRLSRNQVEHEILRLEQTLSEGGVVRSMRDGGHHPGAIFPAEGTPVPPKKLEQLHELIVGQLAMRDSRSRRADRDRQYDRIVGSTLVKWFEQEGRGPAAHPEIWPYLTLVALPDLAARRFGPDARGRLPRDRYSAGRRNVFQRLYLRASILGELLNDPELPLFEDELVGLVDRGLSSDHRLARFVGEQIANLDKRKNRREPVRAGFKNLQFELRVTDVASISDSDLRQLLQRLFASDKF